jgi:hypothetical protein
LIFGLQQVDYTQWKIFCKARKTTIFLVKFRHFCQKSCSGHHIYVKLEVFTHTFCGRTAAAETEKIWQAVLFSAGFSAPAAAPQPDSEPKRSFP